MVRIQMYDMYLQYTSGKSLILADALSCGKPPKTKRDTEQDISIHVNFVKNIMPVRTTAAETDKDEILDQVKTNIMNGSIAHCSPYHNFLQELSIVDRVIIKSNKVVVPTSLRALYWPKMNEDIHIIVSNCDTC